MQRNPHGTPECQEWEVFHIIEIDDTNEAEPVIAIQSKKVETYLQVTPNYVRAAKEISDEQELFRMIFVQIAVSDSQERKVVVQSLSTDRYLAFQQSQVTFVEEPMVLTFKILQKEPVIDSLARLSRHSTFNIKMSNSFLHMHHSRQVLDPGPGEIFDIVVVDGSSPAEPVVAICSRLLGNYLRVTPEREVKLQTFIGFQEQLGSSPHRSAVTPRASRPSIPAPISPTGNIESPEKFQELSTMLSAIVFEASLLFLASDDETLTV